MVKVLLLSLLLAGSAHAAVAPAAPRVTANWTLEPAAPRVNQPARLTLTVCDDASLQWQRPVLPTQSGRTLRALGEDEDRGAGVGETCHRFHWALIATQGGAATLSVPMLDASQFGERLRFAGPTLAYAAAALPAWLPAQVPPVAPHIQADPLPSRWPLNRPLAWVFQVTGGYSADDLKALLDMQLRESRALRVYPPLIETVAPDDSASPLSRHVVTLLFQPRASGPLSVPTLRLPWYDGSRGQLASALIAGKTLTIFDPRWQRGAEAAGGLAGALLLTGLIWQGKRMASWRLARRRGLRAIRAAGNVVALGQAVRQFSLRDQPAAPSLGEWQHRLSRETRACEVEALVQQLEQQLFGEAAPTLAELQQDFLLVLSGVRPAACLPWRRGHALRSL